MAARVNSETMGWNQNTHAVGLFLLGLIKMMKVQVHTKPKKKTQLSEVIYKQQLDGQMMLC